MLCVTDIPTVKLPTGSHHGYIKENKIITHDIPRPKSYGLSMVCLSTKLFQQSRSSKCQYPETANMEHKPCTIVFV